MFGDNVNMKVLLKLSILSLLGGVILIGISVFWVLSHYDESFVGKADCAVVFGAAVWRDDVPSHALYDRTVTALKLYQNDQVDCLVFSGGASTQGAHETDVMKKLALEVGIPEKDLVLDYEGVKTLATINDLKEVVDRSWIDEKNEIDFVLVSNDFHLARIRLLGWKFLDDSFELHAAEYHYGRYWKEDYFFWREVLANLWYGMFIW